MLAREMVDLSRIEALRLPSDSNMARASPFCALDWGFDDEVWLHPDAPPACPPLVALNPPSDPPARARGQRPAVMARSTTSPFFKSLRAVCVQVMLQLHFHAHTNLPVESSLMTRPTQIQGPLHLGPFAMHIA